MSDSLPPHGLQLSQHTKNVSKGFFRSGFARKGMTTDCQQGYSVHPLGLTVGHKQGWSDQAAECRPSGQKLR